MMHYIIRIAIGGQLFLVPVKMKRPLRVLDSGIGTSLWSSKSVSIAVGIQPNGSNDVTQKICILKPILYFKNTECLPARLNIS